MSIPVTAIVLTKNEASVVERTILRLSEFDQVLVVDSYSEDGTAQIAGDCGAEVIMFDWNGTYPKKKQWAMSLPNVRNDWVFFVDADEYPSPSLNEELRILAARGFEQNIGAYDISIDYFFMGSRLRHGHKVLKRALVDRRCSAFPVVDDLMVSNMWEVEGHYQPNVSKKTRRLTGSLVHDDVDPLFDYFARHNRYSDWEAYLALNPEARSEVAGSRSKGGRLFDKVPLKPVVFFGYSYIVRLGFLDGRRGFHYAVALAFYYWQIGAKESELRSRGGPTP